MVINDLKEAIAMATLQEVKTKRLPPAIGQLREIMVPVKGGKLFTYLHKKTGEPRVATGLFVRLSTDGKYAIWQISSKSYVWIAVEQLAKETRKAIGL